MHFPSRIKLHKHQVQFLATALLLCPHLSCVQFQKLARMIRYTCSCNILSHHKPFLLLTSFLFLQQCATDGRKEELNGQTSVLGDDINAKPDISMVPIMTLTTLICFRMLKLLWFSDYWCNSYVYCDIFFSMNHLATQSLEHLALDPWVEPTV